MRLKVSYSFKGAEGWLRYDVGPRDNFIWPAGALLGMPDTELVAMTARMLEYKAYGEKDRGYYAYWKLMHDESFYRRLVKS